MSFANTVIDGGPAPCDLWCVPSLVQFETQYLALDRCTAFTFDPYDCFEFVSRFDSLTIADHFESAASALAWFEFCHEFTPSIQLLTRKPIPFDLVRTVDVRDRCEGGAHG